MKILIVDDELQIRSGLAEGLPWENQGFTEVLTAENGTEAFRVFCEHRPEIIITDIRMPGIDGIELSRKIMELDSAVKIIVLSGHSEFSYAQSAIKIGVADYMLKPINIQELLEKVSYCKQEVLRIRQNTNLLQAHAKLKQTEHIEEIVKRSGSIAGDDLLFIKSYTSMVESDEVFVAYISVDDALEEERATAVIATINAVETLKMTRISLLFTDSQGLFLICPGFMRKNTELRLKDFQSEHNKCLSTTISIALGDTTSLSMLANSYMQAVVSMGHRLYKGAASFINWRSIKDFETFSGHLRFDSERLADDVANLRAELVQSAMDSLFKQYKERCLTNVEPLQTLCLGLKNLICTTLDNMGVAHNEYKQDLPDYHTIDSYAHWVNQLCESFENKTAVFSQKNYSREIIRVVDYIVRFYSEDISLDQMADLVGRSKAHLSTKFKRERGISFVEHLNQVRIEAACKLLLSTDDLTYEISEQVGFNDYKYFHKVFKNTTGHSPTQYRKNK